MSRISTPTLLTNHEFLGFITAKNQTNQFYIAQGFTAPQDRGIYLLLNLILDLHQGILRTVNNESNKCLVTNSSQINKERLAVWQ